MMIAYRSKDFWNKAIVFLADSKTFSLDMISGLEAYAISKAHDAKRCRVENSVNPKYETQGYKMDNSKATINEANTLHATRNSIAAYGVYDSEKFEVLEGSQIDMSRKCHSDSMKKQC